MLLNISAIVRVMLDKCEAIIKAEGWTLELLLEQLGIEYDTYMKALKTKKIGTKVVMKHDMSDIWTNNYNPDVMWAWRANMDLQYVTDAFACVMYIVSYCRDFCSQFIPSPAHIPR
jgi:hypothetical protein